jgi:arylsulfatase A
MRKLNLKACALTLTSCIAVSVHAAQKPNVIIIFNDDMGYQDLGCYGAPLIKTPRIDQLAKEGIRFTDFYACSPVSSASRAALLTGRYPQKVGVSGVLFPGANNGLKQEYVTIAEMLKSVGYATAAIGKWHLGDKPDLLPTRQGFDTFYGIPYSNDMYPSRYTQYAANCLWRDGYNKDSLSKILAVSELSKALPGSVKDKVPLMVDEESVEFPMDQTTMTKRFAEEGIKFIQRNAAEKKPFFLYLANPMPHVPLFAGPDFIGKSKQGQYGDVIEEIDYYTGAIMDELKKLGIDKNTIVIFSSDNGPWLEKKEHAGSALPLYEGKFTSFEGGMRVPCIIRWPKQIPSGKTSSVVHTTIDIFPTLAAITKAKLPEVELDGKNALAVWKGKRHAKTTQEYFFYVYDAQAVRWGDWKYHKNQRFTTTNSDKKIESPALFNLKEDIGETKNVIEQYPEIAARLAEVLEKHLKTLRKK